MSLAEALAAAKRKNLDLVEVAPGMSPPVCRLMNYGKFKYEQAKKGREAKKNQKVGELREIRIRPKIDDHDLQAKVNRVRKLIGEGDKVKVTVMFRGREMLHPELGMDLINRFVSLVGDIAQVEQSPLREGNRLYLVLGLSRKKVAGVVGGEDAQIKDAQRSTSSLPHNG